MPTIDKMDKVAAKNIGERAMEALKVLQELGVEVKRVGSASYDPMGGTMTMKIEFRVAGADPEKRDFERYAHIYGLKPEHFGAEFESGGKRFILNGINPNRPKYPFSAVDVLDRRPYKFGEATVLRKLGIEPNRYNFGTKL